jgi:hypothetical protein
VLKKEELADVAENMQKKMFRRQADFRRILTHDELSMEREKGPFNAKWSNKIIENILQVYLKDSGRQSSNSLQRINSRLAQIYMSKIECLLTQYQFYRIFSIRSP